MREERIFVTLEPDVMKARRRAREMAAGLGFDEKETAGIETAVSELATNLVVHRTFQGEAILSVIDDVRGRGLEVRVRDKGPGIRDIGSAMRPGESTAGGLGIGLSGVRRFMDDFILESGPGQGTEIIAHKWLREGCLSNMEFSVFSVPKPGEDVSGDAYYIKRLCHSVTFSVIDGLGHGKEAHKAASIALEILEENHHEQIPLIIGRIHKALIPTRGAAMAICRINFQSGKMEHLSLGNVETRVFGAPSPVRPFSFNGTLGMAMESYRVIEYPYFLNSTVVMFSDGISGRFDLDPLQLKLSPQEIGIFIFKGFARQTDDATVLVGR
jgi:anti-sigma regulatory factor (Ser/Thr protein kinase)